MITLRGLVEALHPGRSLMRRVLRNALVDAEGDVRLAHVLFSKWAMVRFTPARAIVAISWAHRRLPHPIFTSEGTHSTPTTPNQPPRAGEPDRTSPAHKGVGT